MAQDLSNDTPLTPSGADRNVAGGDELPHLDMSIDAMASALEAGGDFIPESFKAVEPSQQEELALDEPVEAPMEETADDIQEDVVEAETQDGIDEPSAVEMSDKLALSYTDLLEQVGAIEIGGKEYSPADLKSILGQEVSAGKKAREADDRVKALELRENEFAKAEQLLGARQESQVNVNKLSQIQAEYARLEGELNTHRKEGDVYHMQLVKDKQDQLKDAYGKYKTQIDTTAKQQQQAQGTATFQGLRDRGLEYLTQDTPQAKAWTNYAHSLLSPAKVAQITNSDPALVELIEKSRKWDAAQGKEGQKLVSKAKTLKASGRKAPSKTQQNDALKRRIASGQGSKEERQSAITDAFNQQGLDMFRPFEG